MHRLFTVSLIIFFIPVLLSARVPVFVDITAAEAEISARRQANEESARLSGELRSRIDLLEEDSRDQREKISRAEELLEELSLSRGELYGARNRAVDPEQKGRAAARLEENMAQEYELRGMIEGFAGKIADNDILIRSYRKQISRNNLSIKENEEEIDYLRECVTLTEGNENSLDDIFGRQDTASSAFDSFVNANKE